MTDTAMVVPATEPREGEMVKLLLKILGVLIFFGLLLAAFGGGVGEIELLIWGVLLVATSAFVVVRDRRTVVPRQSTEQ